MQFKITACDNYSKKLKKKNTIKMPQQVNKEGREGERERGQEGGSRERKEEGKKGKTERHSQSIDYYRANKMNE